MRKQPVKRVFSSVNFHQPDYGLKSGKFSNGAGGQHCEYKNKVAKTSEYYTVIENKSFSGLFQSN